MHKTILTTSKAPGAIGPYSQGVRANGFVFISGQLPIDPATGEFAGNTIIEQTKQSLLNIKHILESEDIALNDVVKTTVLLKDINDFAAMNEVYAGFFKKDCPARSAFQVAALPKDALVEIEVIAAER
ncbi:RidA family protein [Pectinatus frisingensis]|jgi:2-iminobutanoate/2-iminopropanoate deaminase|uniref:RidA family protein n=1 Tax=Pectinatus frisingensis TaxID=865 RepID=UPI0018C60DD9|nr:RidA family protein [Pectinatus frisingensis]